MRKQKRILVYTDFDSVRNILVKALMSKAYDVVEVKTYEEAVKQLNGTSFGLVITDRDTQKQEGVELVKYMRDLSSYLFTPIMLLHSADKQKVMEELKDYNIACFLNKPFDMQGFHNVVERLA